MTWGLLGAILILAIILDAPNYECRQREKYERMLDKFHH